MMRMTIPLVLLLCCTLGALTALAVEGESGKQPKPSNAPQASARRADVSRVKPKRPPDMTMVYKTTPQGELKLYVYLPGDWKKSDKRPGIVLFFGGGWANHNPTQFFSKSEYFASRGLVAIAPEYRVRKVHGTTRQKCVEDARSVMRYVRSHAKQFGIDPDRLIGGGGSSGGHIAACAALCEGPDAKEDDLSVSCKPQAMVLFNPVLDLKQLQAYDATISPIEFLKRGSPPAIVFFGSQDRLLAQARNFVDKSLALGNRTELWLAEGQGHGFFNNSPWHEATTVKADEFLVSLGYLSGEPTMTVADKKAVMQTSLPAGQ